MINIAIEGESDREAAKAVVIAAGRTIGRVAAAGGKTRLDPKIPKYNDAAKRANWVVFSRLGWRMPGTASHAIAVDVDERTEQSVQFGIAQHDRSVADG